MNDKKTVTEAYWSKEVAEVLSVAGSTLRKWCSALEEQGYKFDRGHNNSRVFYDRDILILRRLKALLQENKMALDISIKFVISSLIDDQRATGATNDSTDTKGDIVSSTSDNQDAILNDVVNKLEKMEEFNRALLSRLDEQQNYIKEQLHKRDEHMIEVLRETMETRKLLAASEEDKKDEKKSFFQKLFGK